MKSSKLNSAMVNWENRTILVNLSRSDESTTFGPYNCTGKRFQHENSGMEKNVAALFLFQQDELCTLW